MVTDLATWSIACGQSLSNGLLVVALVVGTFCMKYPDGEHSMSSCMAMMRMVVVCFDLASVGVF